MDWFYGAIIGAIIGAIVGGFVAAVNGGSIGQGVLFGAIAGAVTGGITSWAGGAFGGTTGSATSSTSMGWSGAASEAAITGQTVGGAMPVAAGSTTAATTTTTTTGGFGSLWKDLGSTGQYGVTSGATQGVFAVGGAMIQGANQQDAQEAAQDKQSKLQKELEVSRQEHETKLMEMRLAQEAALQPADHFSENLAENRRQFDERLGEDRNQYMTNRADAELKRTRGAGALAQARIERRNIAPKTFSIYEQIKANRAALDPGVPQLDSNGDIINATA